MIRPESTKKPAVVDGRPLQPAAPKRPWVAPEVKDLPRLTDLTLQTGGAIPGEGGPGGTVF